MPQEAISEAQVQAPPTQIIGKPRRVGHRSNTAKKRLIASVMGLFLLAGGFFGIKLALAANQILSESTNSGAPALLGDVDPTMLAGEGDGRINILLLGVGDSGHEGGNLSDTMMVASLDPRTKDVAMLSIPRDLYVKIPGRGQQKINAANTYGPDVAKSVVSKMLDLPIHYYIQTDFSAFKQAIDAVGGVDIVVEEALRDQSYPCDKNPGRSCGYYQAAGRHHMNGNQALKYVRCRKGNCGNDFGRAMRQQEVMIALREKATEASTLSNPVKLSKLIDAAGKNVKTDLSLNEIQKLALIAKDVNTSKIAKHVLNEGEEGLLMSGNGMFVGAGYILIPKAGAFNFSEIQDLAHGIFADGYIKSEDAAIQVHNGTYVNGLAGLVAKTLKGRGYNVLEPMSADKQTYNKTLIYDYSGGKNPYTINYLEKRFKTKAVRATRPEGSVPQAGEKTADIKIIVGSDFKSEMPQSTQESVSMTPARR